MAAIPGSVPVPGFVAPTDDTDTYPSHDALYGRGGHRSVATKTARNAISTDRREEGMTVYTKDDGKTWRLKASPWAGTDADWVENGAATFTVPLTNGVAAVVDQVQVDAFGAVFYQLCLFDNLGNRDVWTVYARHNGIPSADATVAKETSDGLENDLNLKHLIEVDLDGVGAAQVMRLKITALAVDWQATCTPSYVIAGAV